MPPRAWFAAAARQPACARREPRSGGDVERRALEAAAGGARAVVRGGDAEMAPECLGELGRLAVADSARDLADGEALVDEQVGGPVHPHAGQVLAERRVADLRVRPLQLAP